MDTPNSQIHDRSLYCLGIGTPIRKVDTKEVIRSHNSKNDIQYNDQKKTGLKNKQCSTKHYTEK